jgi:Putative zinc-finger
MSHPSFEQLVDYWAGDLPDAEEAALEEHVFGCDACTKESARVAAITETFRAMIPPLLSPQVLSELRAKGTPIVENPMLPGEETSPRVPDEGILLHRLGGLDLATARRVSLTLRVQGTEHVLMQREDAPFDRARSEVLVACAKHFERLPPNTVAEVRVEDDRGATRVATYTILHKFAGA